MPFGGAASSRPRPATFFVPLPAPKHERATQENPPEGSSPGTAAPGASGDAKQATDLLLARAEEMADRTVIHANGTALADTRTGLSAAQTSEAQISDMASTSVLNERAPDLASLQMPRGTSLNESQEASTRTSEPIVTDYFTSYSAMLPGAKGGMAASEHGWAIQQSAPVVEPQSMAAGPVDCAPGYPNHHDGYYMSEPLSEPAGLDSQFGANAVTPSGFDGELAAAVAKDEMMELDF